jgi:hypothetical protein
MVQKKEREFARRQHRSLALFLMIQCWVKHADGLILKRSHLERLIRLERFRGERMKWLKIDLKEFFPYQEALYSAPARGVAETLSKFLVSRVPFDQYSTEQIANPTELVDDATGGRRQIALFSLWPKPTAKALETASAGLHPFFADLINYDERSLSAYLTLLTQGLIRVSTIPLPSSTQRQRAAGA